jgi:hypothetical protein
MSKPFKKILIANRGHKRPPIEKEAAE